MSNVTPPPPGSLPSRQALRRSTIVAVLVAIVLILIAVLPAERGLDPTGVGRWIGLTQMGEMKVALAQEIVDDSIAEAKGRARDSIAALARTPSVAPSAAPTPRR